LLEVSLNEKHIGNDPVHAGDASLGGGTTARQCPGAEQWADHFSEFSGAGRNSNATIHARGRWPGRVKGPGIERTYH